MRNILFTIVLTCILASLCSHVLAQLISCNGTNEVAGCEPCNAEVCALVCKLTCVCKTDTVRNASGVCVPQTGGIKPVRCDGPNEVQGCRPCTKNPCALICIPECVCKKDYIRGADGLCTLVSA